MRHLQKSGIITLKALGSPIGSRTAQVQEAYEVHYSDGIRAAKKFSNEKQAIEFAKDLIKSKKGLQYVDVFNAGSGFHSTADTDAIVAWWGKGSYTDNKSKHDSKLASKKINESIITEDIDTIYLSAILVVQAAALAGNLTMLRSLANGNTLGPIDSIKKWWKDRKDDKAVKSIIAKIKSDPEMIEFFKLSQNQQKGKFRKLIATKLSSDEIQYLNRINKSDLQQNESVNEGIKYNNDGFVTQMINAAGKVVKDITLDGETFLLKGNKYISKKGGKDLHKSHFGIKESVNEGKKAFKVNPGIGSSKYSISSHDGVKKHKDGSDFYDIQIFKNKVDLEKGIKDYKSKGFVEESINEENPGLWANIRAKRERGEAPAPKNSQAYKDAVAAGKEINKEQKSLKREALKSIVREVMQEEAEYQKFFQKVLDKAGKSIPSMSDEEKKAFFNKVDAAWSARGEKNESVNEGPFTNVLKMADKNFERHNTIKEKWLAIDKSKMANGIEKLDKKDQKTIENLFKEVIPTDMNTLIPVCKFILSTPAAFSNDILSACRNIVNQK